MILISEIPYKCKDCHFRCHSQDQLDFHEKFRCKIKRLNQLKQGKPFSSRISIAYTRRKRYEKQRKDLGKNYNRRWNNENKANKE